MTMNPLQHSDGDRHCVWHPSTKRSALEGKALPVSSG